MLYLVEIHQMKVRYTLFFLMLQAFIFAQQIGNAGFENWDNLGTSSEEPTNWSSFKTATGSFAAFASQQVEQSTAVRSGANGTYCARIWSKSTLGIMANGVLTTGRMNMGSSNLSSPDNYNYSLLTDPGFSEALTEAPDSIVFWAKYTAGANEKAGMHAIIHDQFTVQDPVNLASQPYVVAEADLHFSPTGNNWQRFSVPFTYTVNSGLAPKFILLTFTTNYMPGGGNANDEVLIDDVELIYNNMNLVQQTTEKQYGVFIDTDDRLIFEGFAPNDFIQIYRLDGQLLEDNCVEKLQGHKLTSGFYIFKYAAESVKMYVP